MLRLDRAVKTLTPLQSKKLADAGLFERQDIQQLIFANPDAFFDEIGETLWLIGQEVVPSDEVGDAIDLLAIDEDGNAVILELKRSRDKLHLLQAISYAGMIAEWQPSDFVEELAKHFTQGDKDRALEDIRDFVGVASVDDINKRQRIVLIAEAFDYEVLVGAQWLHDKYGVDVRCYRLALSVEGQNEFLICTRIFPLSELSEHAFRRTGQYQPTEPQWSSWSEALGGITNASLKQLVEKHIAEGQPGNFAKRWIAFDFAKRRRLYVYVRPIYAYVWQTGRFDGDIVFWTDQLGDAANVQAISGGRELRFYLRTDQEISRFQQAIGDVSQKIFSGEHFSTPPAAAAE